MLHFPSCNPPSFFGRKNVRFYFVDQHFDFDDNLHPRFLGKKMKSRVDVVWILFISDFLVCLLYWISLSWKDSSPFYSCVLGCQAFEWE